MKTQFYLRRIVLILLLIYLLTPALSQSSYVFGDRPVKWELRKAYTVPPEAEQYASADLVILSDHAEFSFASSTGERLARNLKFKINTKKGLETLKKFKVPESFDFGFDSELYKQGRRSRIKTPYMREYAVKVFAARKFTNNRWANVKVKEHYETKRWIKPSGEFMDEEQILFDLSPLAVGDVLELYYEVDFESQYGANIFYACGPYPKLSCEYDFVYRMDKRSKKNSFILPVNIDASKIASSSVSYETYDLITTRIQLANVKANTYPLNSLEGVNLPHVFADFTYYRSMFNYVDNTYLFTKAVKPRNYDWMVFVDTVVREQARIYDKQNGALRKFLSALPTTGSDSQNVVFASALCDTLNAFRFITPNQLFYNESNLYEVYNADHLLKRRLSGHNLWSLYTDLLKEKKIFYYQVNVQDKRLGDHDPNQHVHFAYENNLLALTFKGNYVYLVPREEGLKYHLDELPFYYEDAMAALVPKNIQRVTPTEAKRLKMVRTHKNNWKENKRVEEATVKIRFDSLSARLEIKETLSGQFSTLLRPLYMSSFIDSTVSLHYFKKCHDKPGITVRKTKLVSKSPQAPFPYKFDCSAKMSLKDSTKLELKNWFCFVLSKQMFPEAPAYTYYFDFESSDSYDFLLEFARPVRIRNQENFIKKLSNDYFDLESAIVEEKPTTYRVKVNVIVKQKIIPAEKADLLMSLVQQLEELNNFTLDLKRE